MKILSISLFIIAVSPQALHAELLPIREHLDVHWTYQPEEGWTCEAKTDSGGVDHFDELDDVYLPIDDHPASDNGQRHTQPAAASFAFTGVEPGQPLWIASQIQQPGQCWPGFNNYQSTGVFGAYRETDPRLPQSEKDIALPWIHVKLLGVDYHGSGEGRFSMWQTDSFGAPTVWFSTTEGHEQDTYLLVAGGHVHMNWGFSDPGIYRIQLAASAFEGPGQSNPTGMSETFTLTFAVGDFAQWQAENFTAAELDTPLVSGPDADPDDDGMNNRLEFAFGFDPHEPVGTPVAEGLGLPRLSLETDGDERFDVLEYPRRRARMQQSPHIYTPQFSPDLSSWHTDDVTTTTEDFPAEQAALNAVWEKVTSRRPAAAAGRGFARVVLE